jgi:putative heme degradation protein
MREPTVDTNLASIGFFSGQGSIIHRLFGLREPPVPAREAEVVASTHVSVLSASVIFLFRLG